MLNDEYAQKIRRQAMEIESDFLAGLPPQFVVSLGTKLMSIMNGVYEDTGQGLAALLAPEAAATTALATLKLQELAEQMREEGRLEIGPGGHHWCIPEGKKP